MTMMPSGWLRSPQVKQGMQTSGTPHVISSSGTRGRRMTSRIGPMMPCGRNVDAIFAEIVTPARESMHRLLRQGIAAGEIRPDTDVALVNELLVGPIMARPGSGATDGLDPRETSRQNVDLVYEGIHPR
jgi:hypothetical protein